VAGVDEAGRGSLAGPLVAAGVLLDLERIGRGERLALARLDDSKQKSTEEREDLYPHVIRAAACFAVAVRSVRAIDTRGLHVSNVQALGDCLRAIAPPDALCLVDGFRLPDCELEHTAVVEGDARSAAIAAASVIAKVTRDRYMHRAAELYPGWNFEGNVGYSTPEHRDAIRANGISPLHRRSFASVAYSQLDLTGEFPASPSAGAAGGRGHQSRPQADAPDGAALRPLEGSADVIDIREAIAAEADPDDVEAIARDA
jgi:ribonuclease HII